MLAKLPRKNTNVGKKFYALFAKVEERLSTPDLQAGQDLAWAIYNEKALLAKEGIVVTHPIDLDFLAQMLEVRKDNLLRILYKELDENADFITSTEVNARLIAANPQKSGFGQGKSSVKPVIKYYLTTQAAIQLCTASRAEKARALRKFMAAFVDSFIEQIVISNKQLEAKREQAMFYAKSEHSMQSLLSNVYALLGRRFYTEYRYGNAYADCVYLARNVIIVQEFKRGTVNTETLAGEFATFEANKHLLAEKWPRLRPVLWAIAPSFTNES